MSNDFRTRIRNAIDADGRLLRARVQFAQDYADVFEKSDAGKRVLQDILSRCGMLEHIEAPADADMRSEHAGRRAIGIFILDRLRWSQAELAELARQQTAATLAAGAETEDMA